MAAPAPPEKGLSVVVIGTGRVGLPLALYLADRGEQVHGVDVDEELVATLDTGKVPFIESGAQELLERTLGSSFRPTTDHSVVAGADTIVLTLGTPVDEHLNPVMGALERVADSIAPHLRPGTLIALRSTVSPGTSRLWAKGLAARTGLELGTGLRVAFCPERIAEGRAMTELPVIPQIVGGVDEASTEAALAFWGRHVVDCLRTDAESAELAKLFSNMFRYINFAVANEFMLLAMDHERDIHEILHLVNHDYGRGGIPSPGLTAGPCLYKDGFFLIGHQPYTELITTSWRINEATPLFLLRRLKESLPLAGRPVALLGMGFKADIDDARNSLGFKLRKALLREQAEVRAHDPYLEQFQGDLDQVLTGAEGLVIAMNHSPYREQLTPSHLAARLAPGAVVCDVWNICGTGQVIFKLDS